MAVDAEHTFTPLPSRCTLEQLLGEYHGFTLPISIRRLWEDGTLGPIENETVDSRFAAGVIRKLYIDNLENHTKWGRDK